MYFTTMTLSTVGYGDITPDTDVLKLFTCVYLIVGANVLATAVGQALSDTVFDEAENTSLLPDSLEERLAADSKGALRKEDIAKVLQAGLNTLLWLGLGTVAFSHLEGLKLIDALYFSVTTITTVGFGDITPQNEITKVLERSCTGLLHSPRTCVRLA